MMINDNCILRYHIMDSKLNNGKEVFISIKIDSIKDLLEHNKYTDNFELVFVTYLDKDIPLSSESILDAKKIILKSNGIFNKNAYDILLYIYKNYEFNDDAFKYVLINMDEDIESPKMRHPLLYALKRKENDIRE